MGVDQEIQLLVREREIDDIYIDYLNMKERDIEKESEKKKKFFKL